MGKKKATSAKGQSETKARATTRGNYSYCSLPPVRQRTFSSDVPPGRAALILMLEKKWANGTVLHYYYFDQQSDGEFVYFQDGTREWRTWTADNDQKDVVREAFQTWKDVGIGLEFREVDDRHEAEIRIGFMQGDGAWSFVGRDVLDIGANHRTMNFGWSLTRDPDEIDTAVHEIGHTLGFPHEHQNPNAGLVWDEEAVYAALAKPPNNWSREKTHYNIIRKIAPDAVQGSSWDPNSIMHYPFEAGLIEEPEQYADGLVPESGLSERDKVWVKTFYPPVDPRQNPELRPFESVKLSLSAGQQENFLIRPTATREYDIQTFGASDTVIVLFEEDDGDLRYRTADDDSGEEYNANLRVKLFKGRRYILRVRLYYSSGSGETAIMMW